MDKAALRGEPSYVWREGQERRLKLLQQAAGPRIGKTVLENGCGVGMYVEKLRQLGGLVHGLEYDLPRVQQAAKQNPNLLCGAGENLPYPANSFDLMLSHEVLEHVQDDQLALKEMARCLKIGGRAVIFCPNRGYPFETHGIFWRGEYHFGNKLFINYLPKKLRNRLAPHVKAYSTRDLRTLLRGLPLKVVEHTIIYGAYDNVIARWPGPGKVLRALMQFFEKTPLRVFGLSHFLVVERH